MWVTWCDSYFCEHSIWLVNSWSTCLVSTCSCSGRQLSLLCRQENDEVVLTYSLNENSVYRLKLKMENRQSQPCRHRRHMKLTKKMFFYPSFRKLLIVPNRKASPGRGFLMWMCGRTQTFYEQLIFFAPLFLGCARARFSGPKVFRSRLCNWCRRNVLLSVRVCFTFLSSSSPSYSSSFFLSVPVVCLPCPVFSATSAGFVCRFTHSFVFRFIFMIVRPVCCDPFRTPTTIVGLRRGIASKQMEQMLLMFGEKDARIQRAHIQWAHKNLMTIWKVHAGKREGTSCKRTTWYRIES